MHHLDLVMCNGHQGHVTLMATDYIAAYFLNASFTLKTISLFYAILSRYIRIGTMPHTDRAGDTAHFQILVFIQTFKCLIATEDSGTLVHHKKIQNLNWNTIIK
jgi:hypothetical protein